MVSYPKVRVLENEIEDPELTKIAQEISKDCIDKYKLSYDNVNFHLVNLDELASIVASHGWFQYPQAWWLGQDYTIQKKAHDLANWRVYEIVAPSGVENREPVEAFIYKGNPLYEKKLVMAHVYGHAHVFKNNFTQTEFKPESPLTLLHDFKEAVAKYEEKYGEDAVELILEIADSLSTCIDFSFANYEFEKRKPTNIEELLTPQKDILKELKERGKRKEKIIPPERDPDIFKFLMTHVEMEDWQRELLNYEYLYKRWAYSDSGVKVLHEGFASLIDFRWGMENKEMPFSEAFDYLNHRAAGEKGSIEENPYKLGLAMFLHILKEGNNNDLDKNWEHLLNIVATQTDYTLLDKYFTEEFLNRLSLEEESWEALLAELASYKLEGLIDNKKTIFEFLKGNFGMVKNKLLFSKYNLGLPKIGVEKGGFKFDAHDSLYLIQDINEPGKIAQKVNDAYNTLLNGPVGERMRESNGNKIIYLSLDMDNMLRTLKGIHLLTRKPVYLETYSSEDKKVLIKYTGYNKGEHKYTMMNLT